MSTRYRRQMVGKVDVFYREAGPADAPVILLLHGFPTAGHMFRDLIPILSARYRVIAPDLPGFGNTKAPPRGAFDYTFDNLGQVVTGFVEALGLKHALIVLGEVLRPWAWIGICIGLAGVMAAKPNEPPMPVLRNWIGSLEQAIEHDEAGAPFEDAV